MLIRLRPASQDLLPATDRRHEGEAVVYLNVSNPLLRVLAARNPVDDELARQILRSLFDVGDGRTGHGHRAAKVRTLREQWEASPPAR